jgi:hypothetical protein
MGLPTRSLPVLASEPAIATNQLLIAGVVMPLVFAVANQYLLNFQGQHPPDWFGTAWLWLLFVSQICVISIVCAQLVRQSWHGWIICGWSWSLVDLQVLAASSYARGEGVKTELLLLTALLAAQAGIVVIWSVLGEQKWTFRLPVLLGLGAVLALALAKPARDHYYEVNYSLLFLFQILALLAIGLLLRWRGFSLTSSQRLTPNTYHLPAPDWQFPAFQFGMREFIILATALSLILVAWPFWEAYARQLQRNDPVNLAFAAVLVALRSALGVDPLEIRLGWLLGTCTLSAAAFVISDALFGVHAYRFAYSPTAWQFWSAAFPARGWIFAWMYLTGGLLFATLLLVRQLGYRLQRVATTDIRVEDLKSAAAGLPPGAYALLAKGR